MRPIEANVRLIEANIRPIEANMRLIEANMRPIEANMRPIEANMRPIEANMRQMEANRGIYEANRGKYEANGGKYEANRGIEEYMRHMRNRGKYEANKGKYEATRVKVLFHSFIINPIELTFHMSISGFSACMQFLCVLPSAYLQSAYPHTLCGFFYAVSCGYAHISPHKPQPHMGQFPQDGENGQNVAFLIFLELCCNQIV